MDLINILILASILVTAFLGSMAYFHRQRGSLINVIFSGLALSLILWSMGIVSYRLTNSSLAAFGIAGFHYAISLLIASFFLHFVILYTGRRSASGLLIAAYASAAVLAVASIFSDFVLRGVIIPAAGEKITVLGPGYWVYVAHFIVFFSIAFMLLLRTAFKGEDKMLRRRSLALFLGIFPVSLIGLSTNLVLPAFNIFDYNWVGNVVTSLYSVFMFYAIIRLHVLDLKVVAAEVFAFFVLSALVIELFLVRSTLELIITGLVLAFVCVMSYFSIRSFYGEVDQRTKIEELAKNLAAANQRLKELDKLKSEFVSIASHQLRGPITTIRSALSLVLDGTYGKLPEEAAGTLKRTYDETGLMAQSVEDFLNISRIEQGRMVYEMRLFDLEDLAIETAKEYMPVAKQKGLTLSIAPHTATRLMVRADYGKIKQVIANLIDNSIKYTPKGTITLSLKEAADVARLIVEDTGVGMSKETIEKLFERFSRAPGASLVNVSGTGLGLYVAKQMVEAQEGKVWAESDGEGKGSRFIVELPLHN